MKISILTSKPGKNELCSIISPPKFANESLAIIGKNSKMNENKTRMCMIPKFPLE